MSQSHDFYGYIPSEPAALFAIAYFGITTIICVLQTLFGRHKHYWMLLLAVAAIGEAVGWGARLWAHYDVSRLTADQTHHLLKGEAQKLDAVHDSDMQSSR